LRLFVVTNSDRSYAARVLDAVVGPEWCDWFRLVVTDAGKPGFFFPPRAARQTGRVKDGGRAAPLDGATASDVERVLRVTPDRILFVGDNLRADISPARRRGWRTLHVVSELDAQKSDSPWGGALEHHGEPTWFAAAIREQADLAGSRADGLLGLDPEAVLENDGDSTALTQPGEAP
jgi:hypothetical protein